MNPINYAHPSGLFFSTERLMSCNEDASHDISVVCLWLPNSAENPMQLVDWYCGEATLENTKTYADRWIDKLSPKAIENLLDCQRLADHIQSKEDFEDMDPAKKLCYRLVAVKSRLNCIRDYHGIEAMEDSNNRDYDYALNTFMSIVDDAIQFIYDHR